MKTTTLSATLFAMLVGATLLRAGNFPITAVPTEGAESTTNYQHLADQLNSIITQTASPQQIETALQPVFDANPLHSAGDADWINIRANMASTIFTNLALLEVGLRQTSVVTNIGITPVAGNEYLDPNEMTDAADRQQLVACRSALKAYGEVSNLHRELQDKYNKHWNRAINLLVDTYSRPPAADLEVHKLLTTYAGYDCALQFSNRLYRVRK
jgi:hypothetical protein